MLTYETLRILKNLFLEVTRGEQMIELIRQTLAGMANFEPYVAFQRIDRNRNHSIAVDEILDFLRENQIYGTTYDEAKYLVNFFDSDSDAKLNYSEFMQMLVPCDNNQLRLEVTQRDTYKVEKFTYLPQSIEQELAKLIKEEIEFFRHCEAIRKDLEKRHDFSTYACFRAVDSDNNGSIEPNNLRQFLKDQGYFPKEEEVIAIIRRLDVDADAKISYEEFCEAIKTQDFSKQSQSQSQFSPSKSQFNPQASQNEGGFQGTGSSFQHQQEESKHSQMTSSQLGDKSYQSPSRQHQTESSNFGGSSLGQKRTSPLRPSDENELIKAFKEQLLIERDLEKAKIDLFESCVDFNLFDAFKILDPAGKGYCMSYDIKDACVSQFQLDMPDTTMEDIDLYMSRYDKNGDGKLRYQEFCKSLTPIDAYWGSKASTRGPSGSFNDKTKFIFRGLVQKMFKVEQQAESIRQRLSKSYTFNIYDAFRAVDANDNGKISSDELRGIIEKTGFYVSLPEIKALIERYDKNGDGYISYSEFSDEMRPHSPPRKKY